MRGVLLCFDSRHVALCAIGTKESCAAAFRSLSERATAIRTGNKPRRGSHPRRQQLRACYDAALRQTRHAKKIRRQRSR